LGAEVYDETHRKLENADKDEIKTLVAFYKKVYLHAKAWQDHIQLDVAFQGRVAQYEARIAELYKGERE
jgi:hypothetical protein